MSTVATDGECKDNAGDLAARMEKQVAATDSEKSHYPCALIVKSPTGHPGDASIRLSSGESVGVVQSLDYHLEINEQATCTLSTILDNVELAALQSNTTVKVIPSGHPLTYVWTYYTGKARRLWHKLTRNYFSH